MFPRGCAPGRQNALAMARRKTRKILQVLFISILQSYAADTDHSTFANDSDICSGHVPGDVLLWVTLALKL